MSRTDAASGDRVPARTARAVNLALIGLLYFAAAVAVLHPLRRDYDPVSRYVSECAAGRHGWLMRSAFIALGGGVLALAGALRRLVPDQALSQAGLWLLRLAGIGIPLIGVFPTDLKGAAATPTGVTHMALANAAFLSMFLATFSVARRFTSHPQWRALGRAGLIVAGGELAAIAAYALSPKELVGATERLVIGLPLVWGIAVALRLRRVAHARRSKTDADYADDADNT